MSPVSPSVPYWDVRPSRITQLFSGEAATVPLEVVGDPGGVVTLLSTDVQVASVDDGCVTYGGVPGAAVIVAEAVADGAVVSRRYVQVDVWKPEAGSIPLDNWTATGYVEQMPDGTWHFYYFSDWYDDYGGNIRVTGEITCPVTLDRAYSLVFDVWGEIESVDGHEMDRLDLYVGDEFVARFNPTEDINGTPFRPYVIPRRTESVDLSAYTGQVVELKLRWDTVDTLYQMFDGWFVTDIRLEVS